MDKKSSIRQRFQDSIAAALRQTSHAAFASVRNEMMVRTFAAWASRTVSQDLLDVDIHSQRLIDLLHVADYRLCLDLIGKSSMVHIETLLPRIDSLASDPKAYYASWVEESGSLEQSSHETDSNDILLSNSLGELLAIHESPGAATLYCYVPSTSSITPNSANDAARSTLAIPRCLDLLGCNSLVRKGLMKLLPHDGKLFVTKRANPDKPGRFKNDLIAALRLKTEIEESVSSFSVAIVGDTGIGEVQVSFLCPDLIVGNRKNGRLYSISEHCDGETLEEALIKLAPGNQLRQQHLLNIRALLDQLYSQGVIWGDLAPRNIIVVSSSSNRWSYLLLDFEKTLFQDGPVPNELRVEHCRGPMCVEEFGAVCTLDEVVATFSPYFDPSTWSIHSTVPIPFTKPKREILDLLADCADRSKVLGDYNRVELEAFAARFPIVDGAEIAERPLHLSFKVDHYLGQLHDKLLTQLLIMSSGFGLIKRVSDVIRSAVDCVETVLAGADLGSIGLKPTVDFVEMRGFAAFAVCASVIEELHAKSGAIDSLSAELDRMSIRISRLAIVQQANANDSIADDLSSLFMESAQAEVQDCARRYSMSLIATSGSLSRGDATFGSDIELFLLGADSRKAELHLMRAFADKLDMEIDSYAVTQLDEVQMFLAELPDYFIDFAMAIPAVSLDSSSWMVFQAHVEAVKDSPGFLVGAIARRPIARLEKAIDTQGITYSLLKGILNAWAVTLAVSKAAGIPTTTGSSVALKNRLLYYKSCFEIERRWGAICMADRESMFADCVASCEAVESSQHQLKAALLAAVEHPNYIKPPLPFVTAMNLVNGDNPKSRQRFESLSGYSTDELFAMLPKSLTPEMRTPLTWAKGAIFKYSPSDASSVIDLASMTMNTVVGQNDPYVRAAIASSFAEYRPNFLSSRFATNELLTFLSRIHDLRMGGIADPLVSYRQCNGADAIEIAVKTAYALKGQRRKLVSFRGSYHGQNLTSYLVSDVLVQEVFLAPSNVGVVFLDAPPTDKVWSVPEELETRPLSEAELKICSQFAAVADDSWAILIEPIQCNNEHRVFSLPLFRALHSIAKKHGVMFLVDEVQTAFGWLGRPSACDLYEITPDAICLGKAISGGYGALATTIFSGGRSRDVLPYGTTEKTNGGCLLTLAASCAVMDRVFGLPSDRRAICDDFPSLSDELRSGLIHRWSKCTKTVESYFHELIAMFPDMIERVTGFGLIRGVKFHNAYGCSSKEIAKQVVHEALARDLYVRTSAGAVTIKPSFALSMAECFEGFRRLSEAIKVVEERLAAS
jgi:4-aminobutyrate aminotransferase-like enzyme/predicted nucleotidyltransferase